MTSEGPKPERRVSIAEVHLADEAVEEATRVLRSGGMRAGPKCREFEAAFASSVGASYAISVSSGTAALHVAYLALLEPGDEVIVPTFTFIATAGVLPFLGAIPVFADVSSDTLVVDIESVREKLTPRTRALAPVHLFGNVPDVDAVRSLASEHGLRIVWDAAQAHRATWQGNDVGMFDDVVCYSFYPTKNMTTGEGGMITTNDKGLYERCQLIKSHGQSAKYFHTIPGLNYRMTDVAAAIGLVELRGLDAAVERRRRNARRLTAGLQHLPGVSAPTSLPQVDHAYNQYTVVINVDEVGQTRDDLALALRARGVETGVNYPRPLHRQPVFGALPQRSLPVSEWACERVLSLPVHQFLSDEDVDYVVGALSEAVRSEAVRDAAAP